MQFSVSMLGKTLHILSYTKVLLCLNSIEANRIFKRRLSSRSEAFTVLDVSGGITCLLSVFQSEQIIVCTRGYTYFNWYSRLK